VFEQKRRIRYRIKQKVVASSKSIKGEGTFKCKFYGEIFLGCRYIERHKNHKWNHFCQQCNRLLRAVLLTENNPLQKSNPYSLGVYTTEDIALQYSKLLSIPTVAFRYFNVYGPRQSLNNPCAGALAISLFWLKKGNPSNLFDDGVQLRDYIYVEDVMNVNALKTGSGCYNLGAGKPASIVETIAYRNRPPGTNIEPVISEEFRIGNNRYDYVSMDKFLMVFDATQFYTLENGIKRLINWSLRENPRDNASKREGNLLKCLRQSI
jgi:dTDP-L-rhamnose 4-epimerase